MHAPPAKPALTILAFLGLAAVPDFIPAFRDYKVFDWASVASVLDFVPRENSSVPIADEERRLRPDTDVARAAVHRLTDPGHHLDLFFRALNRTERGVPGAVTTILHFGDSPTTADLITADVRDLFQKEFGNAGHGFALIAKPWEWYGHRGLSMEGSGWTIEPANQSSLRDGLYGLGGVSFQGERGAKASIRLRDVSHTRLEVSYVLQPAGGRFIVSADNSPLGAVETEGPAAGSGFTEFQIPAGASEFGIEVERGPVRLFGARFLKSRPGVIYDSLGLNGAYVSVLARTYSEPHLAEQLRHHKPNLIIINYGTNESVYEEFVETTFARELKRLLERIRRAAPDAAVLVMSPMDRGQRAAGGEIVTVPALQRLVGIEERVAAEEGCAFFNTFEAMGGPGTMGRWYQAEPRLVGADLIHPMPHGARIVGNLLYKSLVNGYYRYKLRQIQRRSDTIQVGGPAAADRRPKGARFR